MKPSKIIPFGLLLFGLSFFLFSTPAATAPSMKVLVFPFDIHAAQDQAFLRQAIMDMLRTRLAAPDRIIDFAEPPADLSPMSEDKALAMGREKGAAYILLGSLTLLGESVSTDARMLRVADQSPAVTFSRTGQKQGAVIAHIDALAAQISQDIFTPQKAQAPAPAAPPSAPAETRPVPDATTEGFDSISQEGNLSYWKSENFKAEVHSLAIGDVDGDGRNETVFVDGSTVFIYRYADNAFVPLEQLSEKPFNEFMRVDIADINQNGKAEIFLTNTIPSQRRMQSFVLEWNGQAYERIADKADWYYRVVHDPKEPPRLLGQKAGLWRSIVSTKDALFEKEVFELKWEAGEYRPAQPQNLPGDLAIFDYAIGDVSNSGRDKIVALSNLSFLTVMNLDGEIEWASDEHYGGSPLYFEVPERTESGRSELFYLPQRVFITDFDQDGLNEIMAVKNHDAARALARVKYFNEGLIECLSYDEIGVQIKWRTRKISGYISDHTIGDFDNNGKNELVFATVSKQKSSFSKGLSAIIACSLN